MFKNLLIVVSLFLGVTAPTRATTPCKVYGISDGPQKLACTFSEKKVSLSCQNGKYFLNSEPVLVAFHLEVEEGSNPLVFKTQDTTLTVVLEEKAGDAELKSASGEQTGVCKKI